MIFFEHFRYIIKRAQKEKGGFIYNILNYIVYFYKRDKWIFYLPLLLKNFNNIKIDRPVFLLGIHKGGLTFVSRIIRRDKNFVSVSGNYRYWSGADEMALVLGPILPQKLNGVMHKIPKKSGLRAPVNWIYASDKYLSFFRKTRLDYDEKTAKKFKKIIKWIIARNVIDKQRARFIDKSQIYTIKTSLLAEILKESNPMFILVTRNPYAMCWSIAQGNPLARRRNKIKLDKDWLKIVCSHWVNSMKCALEDSKEVNNFMIVRLEDILNNPEKEMKKVCDFIEIKFDKDLLPQPGHKIPFGTKAVGKWYPIRPDVNKKYFEKMTQEEVEIIDKYVGDWARKLGYKKPIL